MFYSEFVKEMNMNITKKLVLGLTMVVPMLISPDVFAGHYHRKTATRVVKTHHHHRPVVTHVHRPVVRHVHRPVVVHRRVVRPVVRPVVVRPHYHYGFVDPCFDGLHTTGVFWDLDVSNYGWGVSVHRAW